MRGRRVWVGVALALALAGCSSHAGQSSGSNEPSAAAAEAAAAAAAAAAGGAGAAGTDAGAAGAAGGAGDAGAGAATDPAAAGTDAAAGADPAAGGGAGGAGGAEGTGGGGAGDPSGGAGGAGSGGDSGAGSGGSGAGGGGATPPPDTTPVSAAPDPQAAWLTTPTGVGAAGTQHQFNCPARQPGFIAPGAVYGGPRADPNDGPAAYHEASSVCNAAVHAGRITHAAGGTVTIEMLAAQIEYEGSARNGVTSQSVSPADTASFGGIAFKVL